MFMYLIDDVFCRPEYEGLPKLSGTIKKLKGSETDFNDLTTLHQMNVLASIMKVVCCKSSQGNDLSVLGNGLPSSCGAIAMSKNLLVNTKIIQTSVTGLYEKVLFTVPED